MADIDTPSATPTPQSGGEVPRAGAPISDLAAFGLGALAALCWLAALLLDFQTTGLPGWAHEAAHAALVLVVPAVIVLIGLRHRLGELQTVIALLVMVVAALPALLPVTIGNNPLSLPVRVPTLALGVALGVVVPRRLMPDGAIEPGLSAATVGGAG